ncbi:hypothetical protein RHGRI_015443 [Rhododendron griersonianum]|uniref:Uncharacterized protein n=1 Tax=Rhododendron griersonianum TaxID=479676 RepID=A0AAV6KDQ3_9ERIC|nr:hypothetical protein RHGRI_015443 [Rhododendron griersonianum]
MSQGESHETPEKIECLTPLIGFQPTEMSQENLQESKKLGEASQKTEIVSPFIDQKQFHPTEMSTQWGNVHQFHPTDTSQGGDDQQKLQEFSEKLGQAAQKTESFSSSACIYRVPAELRALKRSAYAPRLISIGPYHRKHHLLRSPMQQVKMSYANSLLRRVGSVEKKEFTEVLQECVEQMKMWKDDANKCYADDDISDGDLLDKEMMVVDGCFILEVLYKFRNKTVYLENLSGSIPPSIGNLTFLTGFNLKHNNFQGEIPQEIGRLIRLQHLNLSYNSFSGKIPSNISQCRELTIFRATKNQLVGQIPEQLGSLSKLVYLVAESNNLSGVIPASIGNLSSLYILSLMQNSLQGTIPEQIGLLPALGFFQVSQNGISGTVPLSIYNISSLYFFNVVQNKLQGKLPSDVGLTLPNLEIFAGGLNNFTGPIPVSLSNASGLTLVDFAQNSLTGTLPRSLGILQVLKIGLSCSASLPRARMPMNIVVNKMYAIRDSFQRSKKKNERTTP